MVSITSTAVHPSAAEYTRETAKVSDASKPAAAAGVSAAETAASSSPGRTAKLTAALAALEKTASGAGFYEQFFPTRDGSPATALARAIVDPGAQSSSAGLTSKEVATDARARMDAIYDDMAASGKPFDINSFEGKDWYSLFADFDRRSLNAVATNADGLFSEEEQGMAQSIMGQQQGWAMGLGGGPTRLVSQYVDPYPNDNAGNAARMKAAAKFLDAVSADEKMSIAWAHQRAGVQWAYEMYTKDEPGIHESLATDNPLVQLIRGAMDTMSESLARGTTYGSVRSKADLLRQPWFSGFEDRLDAAIARTRELYAAREAHQREAAEAAYQSM